MWVIRTAAAAALAMSVLSSLSGVASADPTSSAPAPPAVPGVPAAPGAPAPGPAKTSITADGTYAVGTDIAPGVYASAGPVGDGTCYWRRMGNPDGATIDNALTKKAQTVQIDATDKAFKTTGCQPWQLTDGAAPPPSVAPAAAGLQLQAFMAQLNANAAASGQTPPP
jgi:hypothetical protein